jgi:hypothetical protein
MLKGPKGFVKIVIWVNHWVETIGGKETGDIETEANTILSI